VNISNISLPDTFLSQCAPSPNGGKTVLLKEPAGEEPTGSSTLWRKREASYREQGKGKQPWV